MKRFLPFLLLMLLVVLPFVGSVVYSLRYSVGLTGALAKGFTFQHWQQIFSEGEIWASLVFSLTIASVAISVAVCLALLIVFFLRKEMAGSRIEYFFYLPAAMPPTVVAFFLFQFLTAAGILSAVLFRIEVGSGIEGFPSLVNDKYGFGILIAHIFLATPFFVIYFLRVYKAQNIDALTELALSLGATKGQQTRKIVAPILLRQSLQSILLYWVFVVGSYEIPLLLGSSSPQMISPYIVRKLQRFDMATIPQAYILSLLYIFFLSTLVFFIHQKTKIRH